MKVANGKYLLSHEEKLCAHSAELAVSSDYGFYEAVPFYPDTAGINVKCDIAGSSQCHVTLFDFVFQNWHKRPCGHMSKLIRI